VEPVSVDEKVKLALVLVVVPEGPESIDVSGGVVSGGGGSPDRKRSTSWGGVSPFSRLCSCCSAPLAFSAASRTRKPSFEPTYIACTCGPTSHWRYPAPDATVAAAPVVAG
jgi:hypothetical protein